MRVKVRVAVFNHFHRDSESNMWVWWLSDGCKSQPFPSSLRDTFFSLLPVMNPPAEACVCVCHGHGSISSSTHLSPVPHVDVGAHRLEGTGAAGQQVGAVVGLQETDKVGALRLEERTGKTCGVRPPCWKWHGESCQMFANWEPTNKRVSG